MTLVITMKQHDTRPIQQIGLLEPNPADITTTRVVDLTNAASARLIASTAPSITAAFTSVLGFAADRTTGVVIYTPVAGDTATAQTLQAEIQVTWTDGGIETYPNDSYFKIVIVPDILNAFGLVERPAGSRFDAPQPAKAT